jgi:hypothetical protein
MWTEVRENVKFQLQNPQEGVWHNKNAIQPLLLQGGVFYPKRMNRDSELWPQGKKSLDEKYDFV